MASANFDICAQVLACMRKIIDNDNILYGTNIREKYKWKKPNFIQLADDLESCFEKATHAIPNPIDRSAISDDDVATVNDICAVVEEAFSRKDDGNA